MSSQRAPRARCEAQLTSTSVTSPALSAVVLPSGRLTSSAPVASMPGARAFAVLPADVLAEQRVAVAQGGERGVAVLGEPLLERAQQLDKRRLDLLDVAAERARDRGHLGRQRRGVERRR